MQQWGKASPSCRGICRPCWGAWSRSCPAAEGGHSLPGSRLAEGHREGQTWLAERANAQTQEGNERRDSPSKAMAPERVLKTREVAPTSMSNHESCFDCLKATEGNQRAIEGNRQQATCLLEVAPAAPAAQPGRATGICMVEEVWNMSNICLCSAL